MSDATAETIPGTLFLHIFSNGSVQLQFRPAGLDGTTRAITAGNTDAAQSELTNVFGLSAEAARAAIDRLVRESYADLPISIDGSKLQLLFRKR